MKFQMKDSTRRIVHLFRRVENNKSATLSPKRSKEIFSIRALQQQEFEDIHQVMVEVRRELKIPRMQLVSDKQYMPPDQNQSQPKTPASKQHFQKNHNNQSFAFEPSRLNAEIIQYKRLKQEIRKRNQYQQMVFNSQKDTFRLRVNHNSSLSYVDYNDQKDNQQTSIRCSNTNLNINLPVYGTNIKKTNTRIPIQDLSSTIEDIHSLYITAPPTLQRRVCIKPRPQRIQSLIEKVEDNSIKLINQCKNFFESKQTMNNKFDQLLKTLQKHRPLTQSIRNRSFTFQKNHDNMQSMRRTADEMRKTFFKQNNDQRMWYIDLLQEYNKSIDPINKQIFDELRNKLEDGIIIKADDIIQMIERLNLNKQKDNPLVQQLMNDWDLNFIKQDS